MRLAIGKATDEGRLRTNNEDAFLVDEDRFLFAVADGMGGHRGGEVASGATAIEAVRAAFASGSPLADAITQANTAVITRASGDPELDGMGTTLTALTVSGPRELLIGHVGDSRAYVLHDGDLTRITDDHSLVEEMVRDGRLTPEQAESHPQRAIVTRALGIYDQVDVDLYRVGVDIGDRIVLCSDGLTTMVRERDVERIASEDDPQRAAELLVAAANEAGGEDNTTVIVVEVVEVDAEVPTATTPVGPAVITSAPDVEAPKPKKVKRPREKGSRLRTVRGAILVLLPLVIIIGLATAAVGWYARSSYYVGVANGEVVIFKGVPGGVLGWNPTIDERTGIKVEDLSQLERDQVNANTSRGSLGTAEAVVARLEQTATAATSTTTTTSRPRSTTTTRPRASTTTAP